MHNEKEEVAVKQAVDAPRLCGYMLHVGDTGGTL